MLWGIYFAYITFASMAFSFFWLGHEGGVSIVSRETMPGCLYEMTVDDEGVEVGVYRIG